MDSVKIAHDNGFRHNTEVCPFCKIDRLEAENAELREKYAVSLRILKRLFMVFDFWQDDIRAIIGVPNLKMTRCDDEELLHRVDEVIDSF